MQEERLVMKLIFIGSTQLASFSQILCCLYYIEANVLNLLCFGKELEVQKIPERLLHG